MLLWTKPSYVQQAIQLTALCDTYEGDNCIFENNKDGWRMCVMCKNASTYNIDSLWIVPSLPNMDCYYRQSTMLQCRLKRRHVFTSWQLHNDKRNLVWLSSINHLFTNQVCHITAEYWQASIFCDCTTVQLYNCHCLIFLSTHFQ